MATLAPQQFWTGRGSRWGRKFMDVLTEPRLMFRGVAVVSALFLAAGILQEIGGVSTLVVASMLAGVAGLVVAWRRSPAHVLAAASTVVYVGVVVTLGAASSWLTMVEGGYAYFTAYLTGLLALAVLVLRSRRVGLSPALTTFLAQTALMATLPLQLWLSSASAAIGGLILGVAVVWWRQRLAPRREQSNPRTHRLAGRVWQVVTSVVATLLVAATVMLGSAAPAGAWGFSSITDAITEPVKEAMCGMTAPNLEQQPVGSGPEAWFSNLNLAGAVDAETGQRSDNAKDIRLAAGGDMTQYTLYEISGLRGLDWVNWQYSPDADGQAKPDQCSIPAWMWTMSGNAIFTVNLYVLQATIALKELAQAKNPVAWLYDKSNSVVANVFTNVALPLMGIAMTLAAISIGMAAVRGGGRDAIGKAVASVGVMILAGAMFGGIIADKNSDQSLGEPQGAGFYVVASTLDSMIGQLNSALTTAILSDLSDDSGEEFCHVPPGNAEALGQRVSSCVLAETLAYRPWALGQFGPSGGRAINVDEGKPNAGSGQAVEGVRYGQDAATKGDGLPCYINLDMCRDLRTYLIVQQGGPAIGDLVTTCLNDNSPKNLADAQQCVPYFAAAKVLADRVTAVTDTSSGDTGQSGSSTALAGVDASTMYSAFTGTNGLQRLTQAASSLVATLVIAIALTSLSIITMLWHVMLFALFMIGVLVLSASTFSGKTQMAKEWVFNVLHTFSARFAYGLIMTLIIWLICLVFRSDSIYTGMKIIIVGMVLFGFFKLIRKVDEKIRPKQGSLNVNMADQARRGMTTTKAMTAYAGYKGAQRLSRVPGAVGRGTGSVVQSSGRAAKSTVLASGRAIRGAAVGAVNTLGGEHKANLEASRAMGRSGTRVMARRLVTAPVTGTAGAVRGAYQGVRGRTPVYDGDGTNRGVDTANRGVQATARAAKEVKFQVAYQATRAQNAAGRKINPSRQLPEFERQQRREKARAQFESDRNSGADQWRGDPIGDSWDGDWYGDR
ncbi:hypothetical protein HCA61_21905 [Rhodococcus sp. HNM0563]|uniref:hypothetical protein n=1 Tax=Rhodococcus sp. HNM0563 TaxID=2716339 RepID=UPI00146E20C7|nr:hypothetical protein [Rhodococcus sp. HNM0563]NLU64895.1 hypothetical protein [Rhodococcus sp. HNM0563]